MDFPEIIFLVIVLVAGFFLFIYPAYFDEGFTSGMSGIRCGVDLPICPPGLQCMNGFCGSSSQPPLLQNQLPVYP